ncbi:MAG TPA: VOC family protein [Caulobacteraceae bacterium]|nr:VOC family protein [Caulobacteraceae bacterium]
MVGSAFMLRRVEQAELVCKDIGRTAAFYRDMLGMRQVERFDLPGGASGRVVFDVGDGALLTFLWFRSGRAARRSASPSSREPRARSHITVGGSIAFIKLEVSAERFDAYRQHMQERGVPASLAFRGGPPPARDENASRRSLLCLDPDGVPLEITCRSPSPLWQPSNRPDKTPAEVCATQPTAPAFA